MANWMEWKKKQPYVVKLLVNSIRKNRLPHAYLFEGSKGTGKCAIAGLLAKTIYCTSLTGVEPCNQCRDCRRISSRNHPDVHVLSPEGQSIKIEQIRNLQKEFSYLGVESKRKIYIIEQSDRMTTQAANSLLKLLEEPNQETTAILLTENAQQLLPTIVSRCQTVNFRPLSTDALALQLKEENIVPSLASLAASMTNDYTTAKKLAEDEWFAHARKIVIQLTEEIMERPYQALQLIQMKWLPHFKEKDKMDLGLYMLLLWFRDVLWIKLQQFEKIVYIDSMQQLERFAFRVPTDQIRNQLETVMRARKRLKSNVNPQLVIEQAVLKLQEG